MLTRTMHAVGETCRKVLAAHADWWARQLLTGLAASSVAVLVCVLLWRVLLAAGDRSGAAAFQVLVCAGLALWSGHWAALTILNTLVALRSSPNDSAAAGHKG